jgi:hypothetical protein
MESSGESPQEGSSGYPEEQPSEVDDSQGTPQREGGEAERKHPATGNEDEGTATGNRKAAGT